MKTEIITIANLSCGGCVNTISRKLSAISGVEFVGVDLETSEVTVEAKSETERKTLTESLLNLGYPEATEKNGLLTKMKSVSSCMTGRIRNN